MLTLVRGGVGAGLLSSRKNVEKITGEIYTKPNVTNVYAKALILNERFLSVGFPQEDVCPVLPSWQGREREGC